MLPPCPISDDDPNDEDHDQSISASLGEAAGMKLRLLLYGLAAAAGVYSVYGSEQAASRQSGSKRVVVTYWEKWTGDEMNAMRRVVDKFNASQDRIEVKYLSISGIANKTLLATSGGNPPDVAGLWADQVVQFSDAGALTDLTDMANAAGLTPDYYIPSYYNTITSHGRLYALPTSPGTSALYVNRDLMPPEYDSPEEFPKTISAFNRFVDKVSKRDDRGGLKVAAFLPREGFGLWNMPYLFGGGFMEGDKISVNGPDDVRAWTWVHSFAQKYGTQEVQSFRSGFGSYSSPQNPFLSGKLAAYSDGPWFSNFIRLYNPRVNWFVVPYPYPDDRPDAKGFTTLNLNTLMIPRGAKHVREAFEFVKFVQRQDVMEQLCRDQYCNSPLAAVSEQFLDTHPNKAIRIFDQLARSKRAAGPVPLGVQSQIGTEVGNAMDLIDLGEKSPKAALDDAQRRLEQAWDKYQRQVLGK